MSNDAISIINRGNSFEILMAIKKGTIQLNQQYGTIEWTLIGTVVMYYTKKLSKNTVFIYTVNTVYIVYSEKNYYFFF